MPKLYVAVVLLALSVPGAAQSVRKPNALMGAQELRIKGHVIGETATEFLKGEPGLQESLSECHAPKKDVPAYLADSDAVAAIKRESCETKINALEKSGNGIIPITDKVTGLPARWWFEGGFLVSVSLPLCCDYREIRDDLSRRIGAKPIEIPNTFQNGFGATWINRSSEWTTTRCHAALMENNDPTSKSHYSVAVIETREHYEAEQAKAKNKPSPLD